MLRRCALEGSVKKGVEAVPFLVDIARKVKRVPPGAPVPFVRDLFLVRVRRC